MRTLLTPLFPFVMIIELTMTGAKIELPITQRAIANHQPQTNRPPLATAIVLVMPLRSEFAAVLTAISSINFVISPETIHLGARGRPMRVW